MNYKLINGDCLDETILSKIPNDLDIIFFSPPYNLGNSNYFGEWYNTNTTKAGAKYKKDPKLDNNENWVEWLKTIVITYLEKSQYIFLNLQSLSSNKKDIHKLLYLLNNYYCDKIIWNKDNGIPHGRNSRVMTACFEEIFIFSKTPNRRVGTKEWNGTIKNIFNSPSNRNNKYAKIHAAQWPVEMVKYIYDNFVRENGKVADIMMGLGNSGIAAKLSNKYFYGVELDKDYFNIAKERMENEK